MRYHFTFKKSRKFVLFFIFFRNERNKNNDILNAFEKEKNLEMNIQRLEIENKYLNLLINSVRAERSRSETRMSFRQQNFQVLLLFIELEIVKKKN